MREFSMRYRCNCGGKLFVQETRATEEGIYRLRKCKECGWVFTTKEEAIEGTMPTWVRKVSNNPIPGETK